MAASRSLCHSLCSIQSFGRGKNQHQRNLPGASRAARFTSRHVCCSKISSSVSFHYTNLSKSENETVNNNHLVDFFLAGRKILEYTNDGLFEEAINVYVDMLERGMPIDGFQWFPSLLRGFAELADADMGRQIHGHLLKLGVLGDIYAANSLLNVYWRCGQTRSALSMFERMPEKDSVSWSTMITGFLQAGEFVNSLLTFSQMMECDEFPNHVACLSALSSCASIESLIHGRGIHGFLVKSGRHLDAFLLSKLVEFYMKCWDVKSAENVLKSIREKSLLKNTVIWNVMISGYVFNKCFQHALKLFIEMLELGVEPDSSTFVALLVFCSRSSNLVTGKQLHGLISVHGLDNDIRVTTAVMDMYFKCGDSEAGLKVFGSSENRNLITWGSVISSYVQNGYFNEAMILFQEFILEYDCIDNVILLAMLRACSALDLKCMGMGIQGLIVKMGFLTDVFICGALVDMYAKFRDIESAEKAFHRLPANDAVSWNALISGYAQNCFPNEALKAFRRMQLEKIKPNVVTIACILAVCAQLSTMILCKQVHCYLLREGLEHSILVNNSLIASYAKCGDIDSARTIYDQMPEKDEVTLNSFIMGLGMHGYIDEMFALYERMKNCGMKPDHNTFTSLLSACSHSGKVYKGWNCFRHMIEEYKLGPELAQYNCMVDLLGRAGHLKEAYDLILAMPCAPDAQIWGSLLGSCRLYGDDKLAEEVADYIFQLEPDNVSYRVLLSNLYNDYGKWKKVNQIRSGIKYLGLKKQPGCSWIEVKNGVHTFIAGDHLHCQSKEIYDIVDSLTIEIKRPGNALKTYS